MSGTGALPATVSHEAAGLYIHVPFCLRKCAYCDFYSVTDHTGVPDYLDALRLEMALAPSAGLAFDSLYIGGGTPSLIAPLDLEIVLAAARADFTWYSDVEVTLEVNPCTLTLERLAEYRSAGINRLHIGVQSFQPVNLEWLGRLHSAEAARKAVQWAGSAGFDNIGLDLIYGLPGQSLESWRKDLEQAVALGAAHLSCYMLSFEPGTPLDRRRLEGAVQPAPEEAVSRLYDFTVAFLAAKGYVQYEVSNFARRDRRNTQRWRSRHNQKYWSGAPYLGLGPAAHSFLSPRRYWNHRSLKRYLKDLADGRQPIGGQERLSRLQRQIEAIYTGLRTTAGVDMARYNLAFRPSFEKHFEALLDQLTQTGLAAVTAHRCALTQRGMLLLDSIVERFVSLL